MLPSHRLHLVMVHRESNLKVSHQLEPPVSLMATPSLPSRVRWRLSASDGTIQVATVLDQISGKGDVLGEAAFSFTRRRFSSPFEESPSSGTA